MCVFRRNIFPADIWALLISGYSKMMIQISSTLEQDFFFFLTRVLSRITEGVPKNILVSTSKNSNSGEVFLSIL